MTCMHCSLKCFKLDWVDMAQKGDNNLTTSFVGSRSIFYAVTENGQKLRIVPVG